MDLFAYLKSIEMSPVRWAHEEEFVTFAQGAKPFEELSFVPSGLQKTEVPGRWRVFLGDSEYPKILETLVDRPWSLSIEGRMPNWELPWISIVGSREPTYETLRWMDRELPEFLRSYPCGIISGGARGVDNRAHEIALQAKLPTLIIVPSGLNDIYPPQLNRARQRLIERGATFISEYSDEQVMKKYLFSHRNRLIAALSATTLVIQAAEKSGTIMTAHQAAELNRQVYVLPGHPEDKYFSGNLELLREGAQLITCAQDLAKTVPFEVEAVKKYAQP